MSAPEFSRPVKVKPLPADALVLTASDSERAALAKRFGLSAIDSLSASVNLEQGASAIRASGQLSARYHQSCAVSGDDFPVSVEEPLALRFIEEHLLDADPALGKSEGSGAEIEIELDAEDLDEIPYSGDSFDLGEAIAQTLGLAIDPYAEGPNADQARKEAGITGDDAPSGPLAEALAALKKD